MVPVTVVEAGPCVVTQVKTAEKDGYAAVQLGFGKTKRPNKPSQGHAKGSSLRHLREFRVGKPDEFKVGQELKAGIFNPGDTVTVAGITVGKGFAGNVKRHHHGRGPMTHGSKSHRLPGSIGAGTTPGRVLKGRKMPGRMGAVRAKVRNMKVVSVDASRDLVLLGGSVPGKKGNIVEISRVSAAQAAPSPAAQGAAAAAKTEKGK